MENLLQRLVEGGRLPTRLEAYANTVRMLGNVGTHRFGEAIMAADVSQSLRQLMPILEWYIESERPDAADKPTPAKTAGPLPVPPPARPPPRPQSSFGARRVVLGTVVGKELTRIKSGFTWSVGGQGKPLTFYLNDVEYK